jgi:hypothetical protein
VSGEGIYGVHCRNDVPSSHVCIHVSSLRSIGPVVVGQFRHSSKTNFWAPTARIENSNKRVAVEPHLARSPSCSVPARLVQNVDALALLS